MYNIKPYEFLIGNFGSDRVKIINLVRFGYVKSLSDDIFFFFGENDRNSDISVKKNVQTKY